MATRSRAASASTSAYNPLPAQDDHTDSPSSYPSSKTSPTPSALDQVPSSARVRSVENGYRVEEGLGMGAEGADDMTSGHSGHRHASIAMKRKLWWRNVIITGVFIAAWYIFATLLSLYNKWMFSPEYYNFPYPLFVTACHMGIQFGLAAVIRHFWHERFRPQERPTRREYLTKILPTAASTGGDIGLSNLSLKTITLSLYTMCKSSTLIFVLLFAFTFRLEPYSVRLILVICLISFGVFCMVFNTTAVSIAGVLMVFSASALGGLRWALTELVMHKKAMGLSNPFATIFWLAPLMAVTLGLVSMVVEGWVRIFQSDFFSGWVAIETAGVIALPGSIAFAMVASEYFVIQRAGVVPLSIAGIFKEVSTISISAWVFGDQLTTFNIVGVVITITGIALYSYHKYSKSISATLELDSSGKPIPSLSDASAPLIPPSESHEYAPAPSSSDDPVPLSYLSSNSTSRASQHPPLRESAERAREEEDERQLKDDFEGWDRPGGAGSDSEEELDEIEEDEVERRRAERQNGRGLSDTGRSKGWWGEWLDKSM
ncbi:hypothetical protein L202_01454 [Cryptococcus amylolentus CBS 6039]|uniref:Sugar phosphate transporter domain-containing protein n=2 Tax=Cryptococcus amylolentus TaxID=104669 RepID=A0A1E3I3P8_9TREE|nr:hypothetical protein L202_01454 [Cryptococcus amylolentus CBS 6039]ODN83283.1 hypothetical protein L202_01454 [Cryptococcus amylolentus CBS 6039]ODO10840.1 hypothetical protein I350_01439 [Cryptococcus amylolentus CBS 6273]